MQTLTGKLDRYMTLIPLWALLLIYLTVLSLIAILAYKKKWLTLSGSISAVVLGLIVLWMGGVSAFVVFLFFFVSSSLVSKLSKFVNRREKKGNRRDIVQVLANGVPAVIAIMLTISTQMVALDCSTSASKTDLKMYQKHKVKIIHWMNMVSQ